MLFAPGRNRMSTAWGPGIELCCAFSTAAGKSLGATSAPVPISRPFVIGVNVAVPTMVSVNVFAPLVKVTVSPRRLWSAAKVAPPTTT